MPGGDDGTRPVAEVRPYVITGGRVTAEGVTFDMLVAVAGPAGRGPRTTEGRHALRILGDSYLSVAEISVALQVPLGAAEVVVADLAAAGHVQVFGTTSPGRGRRGRDAHQTLDLLGSVIDGIDEL